MPKQKKETIKKDEKQKLTSSEVEINNVSHGSEE